jgi:hypothetical protein
LDLLAAVQVADWNEEAAIEVSAVDGERVYFLRVVVAPAEALSRSPVGLEGADDDVAQPPTPLALDANQPVACVEGEVVPHVADRLQRSMPSLIASQAIAASAIAPF